MAPRESEAECIFLDAVEHHAPHQWAEYVQQAAAGDPALVERVEALLRGHGQANPMLDEGRLLEVSPRGMPGPTAGMSVGPYKLLEQIGEGGMGLVYVAEQQHPIRRRVALKIIKPGMDSRQVVARFEAERQALAMMDHANIAKVHDGGTTPEGRPYFVMELVKGTPITDYCDTHRLDTRQRLELFLDVCHAVQHAHQKGIIHRDLKPSNVLVSHHDVRAVVKVIDFGIAKATGQRLTERTIYTSFSQMIGTPLYMSPEQAGLSDLDVDTRSDVYSLGVILYELLTSTTPFDNDTLKKAGHDEMRRIIREDEPPRPSTRLSTMQQARLSTIAERRGQELRRLSQQVRGELDWIVMKALEKDRARRYESASAFAADVKRYLDDEPVEACPPSATYRLRKLTRRNRRFLVPACVIAVTLAIATVVSTWQAVEARDAQRQAEIERVQAEADRDLAEAARRQAKTDRDRAKAAEGRAATEAAIARAVNDFLQGDLLGQVGSAPEIRRDPQGDPYLTVKEALDRAAARIGARFRDQPLVEAGIRTTIGVAYHSLFEIQLAVPHLERAVALRKAHLGPDHPDTIGSMSSLADAYRWVGRHPDSIALRRQLLEHYKALHGPDHPTTLSCAHSLARAYEFAGELDTSRRLLEQLLDKRRSMCGPTHPDTLGTMADLAKNHGLLGRLPEAIAMYEKCLETLKSTFGPDVDTPLVATALAEVCQRVGRFEQADRLLRERLARERKKKDSVGRRNEIANILGFLAANLLLQQRYDEAEPFARQAVASRQVGDLKRNYWVSVLGAVLLGQRKYAEAEPFLLRGYEDMKQQEDIHPAVRRRVTEVEGWIVRLYEATDQPEKASAWREKLKAREAGAVSPAVK